ncbi:uncharacterized protein LOC106644807 [Copidosoma floridanum]|uniref:uncharacterized protein LOC106644807 n=1 Tax=Copidosoma floridanum TaxID=29053 RepID=UPI000C6F7408|nr:uncharacterized protein LOC106644807 [Copidosoma floridanum]
MSCELTDLAKETKNIEIIEIGKHIIVDPVTLKRTNSKSTCGFVDLTNTAEYPGLVKRVKDSVGDAGLNVLFNNAGTSNKFTRLSFVKEEQLIDSLRINTVAPILLAKAFLPLLKQAAAHPPNQVGMSVSRAAVINMSSILGSIENNDIGGFYPYRCSKAALNAATKSMSLDLKDDNILCVALHPGWVKTAMGGPNAPMDVETCINNVLSTIRSLTEKNIGAFLQFDGKMLPW